MSITNLLKHHYREIVLSIVLILMAISIFGGRVDNWGSDPLGALVVSQNILQNGTINLNPVKDYWKADDGTYYHNIYKKNHAAYYYSYPLGTPIISIPFVLLGNIFGINMLKQDRIMQEIICSIVALSLFLIIFTISRYYFSFSLSMALGLLGFYGTTIGSVVGTGLWNFDYEILFIGISTLLTFFMITKKTCKYQTFALLGFTLFLAFISRPTAAFFIAFLLSFLFGYNRKGVLITVFISGILFISYESFMLLNVGNIFNHEYALNRFSTEYFIVALKALIWSPSRSLFIFNPFLLILPVLLFYTLSLNSNLHKKAAGNYEIIKFLKMLLFFTVAETIFLLFWRDWWGGVSYGPRIYTEPVFLYLLISIIALGEYKRIIKNKSNAKTVISITIFLLFLGMLINVQGVYNRYAFASWNNCPNIDKYPDKIVFDWRFPQFLMTKNTFNKKCLTQSKELGIVKR